MRPTALTVSDQRQNTVAASKAVEDVMPATPADASSRPLITGHKSTIAGDPMIMPISSDSKSSDSTAQSEDDSTLIKVHKISSLKPIGVQASKKNI